MGLSSVQQQQQPGFACNCKSEDIFAPIKSKMKVLKKIKKRIGLGKFLNKKFIRFTFLMFIKSISFINIM